MSDTTPNNFTVGCRVRIHNATHKNVVGEIREIDAAGVARIAYERNTQMNTARARETVTTTTTAAIADLEFLTPAPPAKDYKSLPDRLDNTGDKFVDALPGGWMVEIAFRIVRKADKGIFVTLCDQPRERQAFLPYSKIEMLPVALPETTAPDGETFNPVAYAMPAWLLRDRLPDLLGGRKSGGQ